MLLHGTYDDGKITILNKKFPKMKANVEIKITEKPWVRKVNRIKLKKGLFSEVIISERYSK